MSIQKTMSPELDDVAIQDNETATFRIRWYKCNVCGTDFEDANPSHRRRLHLLLEHKRLHRPQSA